MKNLLAVLVCISGMFFMGTAYALNVSTMGNPTDLVNAIVGPGITVVGGSTSYVGVAVASGTFTGGISSGIGISSGVLLTTGSAALAVGPNNVSDATHINNVAGSSELDALVYPLSTRDATVLEFDFVTTSGNLYFNYVFASEEYNEFANSTFNDIFAIFLDDVNIALIPGTTVPVSINNVNGGNPYGTGAVNPDLYNNNDPGGPYFDIQYDGFTDVFTASAIGISNEETHHIRFAIADVYDASCDSGIFIQAGSFSDSQAGPSPVPVPGTLLLMGSGLMAVVGYGRRRTRR